MNAIIPLIYLVSAVLSADGCSRKPRGGNRYVSRDCSYSLRSRSRRLFFYWGSLVAYAKLEEWPQFKKPYSLPRQQLINVGLLLLDFLFIWVLTISHSMAAQIACYLAIGIVSSVLGVFLVNPIGGADMPVVISLMNSYSGVAGAATGFVLDNNALIISGSLVGASGIILTQIMCKAMNRSLSNVLFGVMAGSGSHRNVDDIYANVRSTSADDIAMILDGAHRIVFVPGYGMAVAQAQGNGPNQSYNG